MVKMEPLRLMVPNTLPASLHLLLMFSLLRQPVRETVSLFYTHSYSYIYMVNVYLMYVLYYVPYMFIYILHD